MMLGMIFVLPILLLLSLGVPLALGLGGYLLYRKAEESSGRTPASTDGVTAGYTGSCISCGRFVQEGWIKCPYCGAEIPQAIEQ